jgi:hypothetical protein
MAVCRCVVRVRDRSSKGREEAWERRENGDGEGKHRGRVGVGCLGDMSTIFCKVFDPPYGARCGALAVPFYCERY